MLNERKGNQNRSGIVLINKPISLTSFKALSKIKEVFKTKKVGHSGTLDPFASGLLVAGINNGTKIMNLIEAKEKTYEGVILLGSKTSTGDHLGKIIKTKEIPILTKEIIKEVFKGFIGNYYQKPPIYSAIKIKGKKLYEYAREGKEVEIPSRLVEIVDLELIEFNEKEIRFTTTCSKGTYVRVLAEDIANKLETEGHLIALKRTKIGDFDLKDAHEIENIEDKHLLSITKALKFIPKVELSSEEKIKKVYNGSILKLNNSFDIILIVDKEDNALALYQKEDKHFRCVRGLW